MVGDLHGERHVHFDRDSSGWLSRMGGMSKRSLPVQVRQHLAGMLADSHTHGTRLRRGLLIRIDENRSLALPALIGEKARGTQPCKGGRFC